jgi:GTP cyclohydrolase I
MEDLIKELLVELGENPEREGLVNTPRRVKKSLEFFTSGYNADITKIVNGSVFDENIKDMVIVKDIEFYSMCEHHMIPFYGKCHIGYIPRGKVIGLSKLPRIVDVFSRRLQLQERLTSQIAHTIYDLLNPYGLGIVMEANHLCMMMRGVQKQNSKAVTSCMLGSFQENPKTRTEFLTLINN